MAIERIIDTKEHEDSDEKRIENSLRPQTFKEYIGQDRLKKHLKLAIENLMLLIFNQQQSKSMKKFKK